ncbi:MAG: SDR family oxidoreductase [Bryobacteraceae bacterium]|jgi:NAD(P)-dependent dehydrogenase (short-subunit alcohol dehydrogenase family)
MERFLDGKVVVVTGGTRGIGRAIAAAVLEAGANVGICGRNGSEVDRVTAGLRDRAPANTRVLGTVCDISRPDQVRSLFEVVDKELDGIDVLVNNAGVGVFGTTADLSIEQWRQTMDTNLSGAFYCSREALQRFRARGSGYIVNISSLAGKNSFAGGAAYNASKFGLNGFSEAMMLDHRHDNVRVSYIMPGSVDTGFGGNSNSGNWKIAPSDIAEIVIGLLRMPARTLVSRVEVRPSKPNK